mgnify:FL=1
MVFMPIPAIHPDVSEGGMGGFIGVVSFGGVVPGGITTLKSRLRVPSFSVVSPCMVTCGVGGAAETTGTMFSCGAANDFAGLCVGACCVCWQEKNRVAKSSEVSFSFMFLDLKLNRPHFQGLCIIIKKMDRYILGQPNMLFHKKIHALRIECLF